MKCKIEGCTNPLMYKKQQVCQNHYFLFRRNGTYEKVRKQAKYRITNPAGYQKIKVGTHPLPTSDGYIYEHRKVVFDIYGFNLPDCEICGNPTNWETCHIDHIDKDVSNNNPENLRPLCRVCNVGRTEKPSIIKHELDGLKMSITEWSKQPGVAVCRHQIMIRLAQGMVLRDALYSRNATHPKK